MGAIRLSRVYDHDDPVPGRRILVERLWPRGVRREDLEIDGWAKDAAPSAGLRAWFGHDPARWTEFRRRYFAELDHHPDAVAPLLTDEDLTLLYSSRDREHNNAVALRDYLQAHLDRRDPAR